MSRGKTVINLILAEMAKRGARVHTSDQLAKALKLDPARVRDSLQNYSRHYPQGPVERISTGVFRWKDVDADAPVSPAPVATNSSVVAEMVNFGDTLTAEEKAKFMEAAAVTIDAQQLDGRSSIDEAPAPLQRRDSALTRLNDAHPDVVAKAGQELRVRVVLTQDGEDGATMFFLFRGKMWKAYEV